MSDICNDVNDLDGMSTIRVLLSGDGLLDRSAFAWEYSCFHISELWRLVVAIVAKVWFYTKGSAFVFC